MPVFYFDYDDGQGFVRDHVGTTLLDLDAARLEVSHVLAEVASDAIPGTLSRTFAMEVRDEHGVPRLRASLNFVVELLAG